MTRSGPSFFVVNLRLGRTFGFGEEVGGSARRQGAGGREGGAQAGVGGPGGRGAQRGGGGRGGGGRGGGGGGGRGGGGAFGDAASSGSRYSLALSLNVQNLLNHTNLGVPIGNLTSPLFGQSNTTAGGFGFGGGGNQAAGNRRLELSLRFAF